ncbi:MAG: GatB/YqeY domain-containing protein [Dehalococcoidales bacterium]|nr:GatB/YqeY domain-containing protein [Dehalococcoidales bacterium]
MTELKQKLTDDLKQAMKARDETKRSVLRMLLAAIHNVEIAKRATLSDADILGIIAKGVKQHHESIDAFKQGDRHDLVAKEETELAILQGYLPEPLGREDVVTQVRKVIEEVGAQGPRDKGKVMSRIIPQLKGRADGSEINSIVTELLSS